MSHVVTEQPLQIRADKDPSRSHHLHPRTVWVALPRHDLHVGGLAPAHHEVTDPHAQQLAQPVAASSPVGVSNVAPRDGGLSARAAPISAAISADE